MFQGYKCFEKGLINRYGFSFKEGVEYHSENSIKFGNNGNGFHVCLRLEDTLRYFDAMDHEVDIAKVSCHGNYDSYEDDYNEYYDMYAFEYMKIDKVLTRKEIMEYALQLPELRANRFLSLYRLTEEEKEIMKQLYVDKPTLLKTISYYQDGNKDTYLQESKAYSLKK